MESKRFKRKSEDFTCFNCGTEVRGTGYTDHCPNCLWGMHVDNNPGDRTSRCRGHLRPVASSYTGNGYEIYYVCDRCGAEKKFGASENDNTDALLALVESGASRQRNK